MQEIISLYRVHRQYLQVESGGGGLYVKFTEKYKNGYMYFSVLIFFYIPLFRNDIFLNPNR